ncbi:MAG: hypothetical protein WCK47_03640 [bacterium]
MTCPYFKIKVIDSETRRGVPLIRLNATGTCTEHFTDSNGLIAYYEPGLMGRRVYFLVDGHGYCLPKNEFGERGIELIPASGGKAVIEVERLQPAQRIYRITGQGICRDTLLLGEEAPINEPALNAGVCGQDSAQTAIYKGKIFWIWGDTKSPRFSAFWNFKVTGAVSELPENGGLDPDAGVNLKYFTKDDFTKQMMPLPGGYLYWLGSLHTIHDETGRERLLTFYVKVAGSDIVDKEIPVPAKREEDDVTHRAMGHGKFRVVAWGRAIFNDEKQEFESLEEHDIDPKTKGGFGNAPFVHADNGRKYLYFTRGIPIVRVPYEFKALGNPARAEFFTCLKAGCHKAEKPEDIDRDERGRLKWGWKTGTESVDPSEADRLVTAGLLKDSERLSRFTDTTTGRMIHARGMIAYNPYRKRWIAILLELGGTSALGEVWYLEADTPLGPWVHARKIVTHSNYSFYNVIQHPYFAKDGGRYIYFEGTYTYTFTHPLNTHPTPRYDYNQIMYKLDLEDPRLCLPVAIYRYEDAGRTMYRDHAAIPGAVTKRERVFFAPDRPRAGTVAIHEDIDRKTGATVLTRVDYDLITGERLHAAFYGIPPEAGNSPPQTAPILEYIHTITGVRLYSIQPPKDITRYYMSPEPVCLVWKSPIEFDPFALGQA